MVNSGPIDEPRAKRAGSRAERAKARLGGGNGPATKGAEAFVVSPFSRFARAHAFSAGGDALFAIALADSIFFSIDPNDARWLVALYLLVTAAPFAVVAPLLGPAMDRLAGGHRFMVIGAALVRAVLVLAVAKFVGSLLLFPLAFTMLVFGKTHHVAKSALVPGLVRNEDELVAANSRLSIISALSAGLFGLPGVLLLFIGPTAVLIFASLVFATGAVFASRIPATKVASTPAAKEEKAELRGAGIILAASAMGYVRGLVGFLTMLLAFELRGGIDPGPIGPGVELGHRVRESFGLLRLELATGGAPTWHFGVVLVATGIGGLSGGLIAPKLRTLYREERILAGVLGGVAVAGLLATLSGGLIGAMLATFAVAIAGTTGKQSFDAIVQRDAPEANLGRSFSKFESRFQLVWVLGALMPVVVPIPARLGFLLVAGASAFAAVSYWLGRDPSPNAVLPRERLTSARRSARGRAASRRADPAKDETDEMPVDLTREYDLAPVPGGQGAAPVPAPVSPSPPSRPDGSTSPPEPPQHPNAGER